MPFSIDKLIDAISENKQKQLSNDRNPDIPSRYKKINDVQGMKLNGNKNHNYSPFEFDHFNEVMKQTKTNRYNISGLHLDLKQKKGTEPLFQETEGWIDPANRRRNQDPNHAPPFDYVNGAAFQKFSDEPSQHAAYDNVSLIQSSHAKYQQYINRYNVVPTPVTIKK